MSALALCSLMRGLRQFLIAAAVLATGCVLDRAGTAESHTQYSLIVDRTSQEGLGGKISTVQERTFAEMRWMRSAGEARARLRVDSVQFSRDGRPTNVGPATIPLGIFVFRINPDGRYAFDSLPGALREHPYLATVALELPDIRISVAPERCRSQKRWMDSASVGPVPVPGVDGAIATYRTSFVIDSIRTDTVAIHAVSDVTIIGASGRDTLLKGSEHRDEHWLFAELCRGPASSIGATRLTLVYFGTRNDLNDTVTVSEQRSVAIRPH